MFAYTFDNKLAMLTHIWDDSKIVINDKQLSTYALHRVR